MAASVEPRQFGRLEPVSPPVRGASSGIRRRADSPVRGCGFPALISPPRKSRVYDDASDDDEEEQEDWRELYGSQLQFEVEPSVRDLRDEGTADAWIERNPSLIRLTGKHPLNCEPPLARLMHHGFITPAPLHYVRNHGAVPRGDWSTWTVEVTGLVKRPARFTMDELANEFPALEVAATLVCAGNRRKEQNMVQQTVGFNWGAAGVSTSVWRGVRLRDLLRRCGMMGVKGQALNVCFEGAEDLPGGGGSKYGTSITREWALDPSRDIMLAYMQNGELLLPDHGFPVRAIIPGCIGGRMVKWVKRIIVTAAESDNYYHFKDNRVLPSHVDAELANAEAWWYKPEHIINELNTNSVITTPGHDEILPINAFTTQRAYTMKGYAYSGGGKKITRVEVTLDGGETWLACTLDIPEKPNKYGRYWCWCFWSVEIEVLDLLGAKEVAVRAWDQTHNTQPEKLIWNLMGMMNNCWFKVKVNVCRPHKGEIGLVFEHPTQPGNQTGGWMARQKHLETAEAAAPGLKRSTSTPFLQAALDKQFTMSEVRKHGSKDSAWIVVHGHVYDCTAFLKDHPGGADSILINAGSDCTEEFDAIHSDKAKALLDTYRIGELITTGTGYNSDNSVHGGSNLSHLAPIREATKALAAPIALSSPREKVPCRLIDKKELSHDVRLFRFALPSSDQVLGLSVGKHIFVCATIEGKLCMRAYTPTSMVDEIGHFELLIKVYFKDEHPKFPNGGLMTQHLESLQIGSYIDVKGPLGHVEYTGRGNFVINGKQRQARRLAMICGGSGITPMYQVIQAVLRDQPEDETEMHLVYANRTARFFSAAEAKRPRVDNGDDDAGAERGASLGGSGRIGGGGLGFSSSAGGGHGSTISPLSSQGSAHQYSSYGGYQSGSTTKKIDIPNGRVGVIIGKSGETIKHLQLQSGAKIQVTRDMDVQPGSQTRSVDLSGTPDQISRAEQLINDVLAEADAGASGTVSNRKYNPPQPGSEQFQMQIANNKVGLVIGKGGETIKSMQAKSGARIQVIPLHLPPGDPATERTLYIDGTVEQIEIAKQLVNEVTSENRARNTMSGGYPQQGYRPPRPQANWAPGAPATQQPGYGYMQPGAYPGAPPQYGQPPYSSYPPASGGYQTGWDQSSNQQPQQTPPGTGYDYYNQQQQPQQQPAPGTAAPADASSYNYSQPATYASQGYGDSTYSQQSGGQQAYDYSGYQNQGQQQPAYSQQTGYDQQSYGTTGYGSAANSTQDGSAPPSYGGPGGASQASPGKQASTPATGSNPGYSTQPPTSAASSYPAQGSVPPSGYAAPQTQASYGAQPPAQGGYGQGSYGQSPQGQKPPTSAPYGQAAPPASAQAGGYGQYGYGQPGYGAPPPYPGAPPASHPGYGQQQSYGDPYGSGSYGQPPAYSTEATTPAASQDQSAAAPAPAPTTTNAAPPAPANSGPAQTSS